MDTLDKSVVTLLLNVSTKSLMECIFESSDGKLKQKITDLVSIKEIFADTYYAYNIKNSVDDVEIVSEQLFDKDKVSVFDLIIEAAEKYLIGFNQNSIVCKKEKIIEWTNLTNKIDQDLLICAFLSADDHRKAITRDNFLWNAIAKTDNLGLNTELKKGVADNHFHLMGSSITYELSWISIMNNISLRNELGRGFANNLMNLASETNHGEQLKELIEIAYLIRLYLYSQVSCEYSGYGEGVLVESQLSNVVDRNIMIGDNKALVQLMKINKLAKLNQYIDKNYNEFEEAKSCKYFKDALMVDYIEITNVPFVFEDFHNPVAGERFLNYSILKKIKLEKNVKISELYYFYIVVKMKFRAQLIQANDRFGFANFKQYQERKGKLITDNSLIAPLAISRTLDEQKFIKSIEARIIPRKKERELYAQVIALDKRISVKEQLNQKYYYVLHIPKYKDSFEPMEGGVFTNLDIYCRHYKLRKSLLEYYVGIRMVLENHANMGDRIKGIDACSNEIGCRPEVFGQFYRAVKNTRFVIKSDACATTNNEVYLKATYHVGEDFLDPIDGLRSVEEALIFLNLSNGDRIGHGTVLGINIERWYDEKNWCVHLRSQDLLDNLCWMLRKAQKNDIYIEESQRQEIESYIKMLYIEIYLNSDINSSETYVEEYYYFAWLLRGDNPLIYEELSVNIVGLFNEWDEAATNIIEEADLKQIRKLMPVVQLIRKYHYNKEVKLAGNRAKEYTIPRVFSEILEKLQKVLCEEICNKNIFIEANPTSNVLINNFKRYEDHPIYNLSNRGLKGNNKTDVKVTINTDDQGVFNNSLENEYALIYSALTRSDRYMTQYDKNDIESWIASIRENGLDATFN